MEEHHLDWEGIILMGLTSGYLLYHLKVDEIIWMRRTSSGWLRCDLIGESIISITREPSLWSVHGLFLREGIISRWEWYNLIILWNNAYLNNDEKCCLRLKTPAPAYKFSWGGKIHPSLTPLLHGTVQRFLVYFVNSLEYTCTCTLATILWNCSQNVLNC
jgi:hypothetical protein